MVILAGQSIYKPDVERFRRLFAPTCQLLYRLAMTEAGSVTHLVFDQQSEVGRSSVGYPTADKTILLVDETGNEVKPGDTGQIAIRSRYLSAGYWRNPTLTASKFLIDPQDHKQRIYLSGDQGRWQADGALEYLGRQDNMVKIRGYRVELGAIENALLIDLVKESAVVPRRRRRQQTVIGYLVPTRRRLDNEQRAPTPATELTRVHDSEPLCAAWCIATNPQRQSGSASSAAAWP